ncbi:hypothetical protein HDK90DRAFT_298135, partial [Phyllosticta capitalensis]
PLRSRRRRRGVPKETPPNLNTSPVSFSSFFSRHLPLPTYTRISTNASSSPDHTPPPASLCFSREKTASASFRKGNSCQRQNRLHLHRARLKPHSFCWHQRKNIYRFKVEPRILESWRSLGPIRTLTPTPQFPQCQRPRCLGQIPSAADTNLARCLPCQTCQLAPSLRRWTEFSLPIPSLSLLAVPIPFLLSREGRAEFLISRETWIYDSSLQFSCLKLSHIQSLALRLVYSLRILPVLLQHLSSNPEPWNSPCKSAPVCRDMSLSTRPYSICFMPGYPICFQDGLPQLPLRQILFTPPASRSAFNMGYSGRAKSKRRRFVPPEIWLQVIKSSMPSMISVSKMGRNGQNTGRHGFHLFLFFSELPHIMNLAQVSKTWYMEVKEAFYTQPLWSFDTIHCALSNFLSVRGQKEARFVDYDAAISRIRHVHIRALRMPCYTGERSPAQAVQVSSAPTSPEYQQLHRLFLLENLKHVYIDVGSSGFQEMGQKFKPDTAASLDTALSGASDLIARFGQRFARVLSFHELAITKRPAQKTTKIFK